MLTAILCIRKMKPKLPSCILDLMASLQSLRFEKWELHETRVAWFNYKFYRETDENVSDNKSICKLESSMSGRKTNCHIFMVGKSLRWQLSSSAKKTQFRESNSPLAALQDTFVMCLLMFCNGQKWRLKHSWQQPSKKTTQNIELYSFIHFWKCFWCFCLDCLKFKLFWFYLEGSWYHFNTQHRGWHPASSGSFKAETKCINLPQSILRCETSRKRAAPSKKNAERFSRVEWFSSVQCTWHDFSP